MKRWLLVSCLFVAGPALGQDGDAFAPPTSSGGISESAGSDIWVDEAGDEVKTDSLSFADGAGNVTVLEQTGASVFTALVPPGGIFRLDAASGLPRLDFSGNGYITATNTQLLSFSSSSGVGLLTGELSSPVASGSDAFVLRADNVLASGNAFCIAENGGDCDADMLFRVDHEGNVYIPVNAGFDGAGSWTLSRDGTGRLDFLASTTRILSTSLTLSGGDLVVASGNNVTCTVAGGCDVGESGTEMGTVWAGSIDDADGTVDVAAALTVSGQVQVQGSTSDLILNGGDILGAGDIGAAGSEVGTVWVGIIDNDDADEVVVGALEFSPATPYGANLGATDAPWNILYVDELSNVGGSPHIDFSADIDMLAGDILNAGTVWVDTLDDSSGTVSVAANLDVAAGNLVLTDGLRSSTGSVNIELSDGLQPSTADSLVLGTEGAHFARVSSRRLALPSYSTAPTCSLASADDEPFFYSFHSAGDDDDSLCLCMNRAGSAVAILLAGDECS